MPKSYKRDLQFSTHLAQRFMLFLLNFQLGKYIFEVWFCLLYYYLQVFLIILTFSAHIQGFHRTFHSGLRPQPKRPTFCVAVSVFWFWKSGLGRWKLGFVKKFLGFF